MAGGSVGTIFAELDLDATRYTKGQQKLLQDATSTTLNIEQNFKNLHIKSAAEMDLMRQKITNSYERIAASSQASANDIIRAEKAKNDQLTRLNEQQFGSATSFISELQSHWLAASAVIYGAFATIGKVMDLVKAGAKYDEQRSILDNLARKYGTTADSIVADMKRASDGQVANADLMQVALSGLAKGLNPEQFTNLSNAATILGKVVGKDATTALQELTEGLESGRVRGLKGYLGSTLDLHAAFGDLVGKMTDVEKAHAMYNMTMIQSSKLQAEQVTAIDGVSARIERQEATWKNLKTEVASFFKTLITGTGNVGNSPMMEQLYEAVGAGPFVGPPVPPTPVKADTSSYEADQAAIKADVQARKDAEEAAKKARQAWDALQKKREELEAKARGSKGDMGEDWLYGPTSSKAEWEILNQSWERTKVILNERTKLEEKARAGKEQGEDWLYGPTDEKMALKIMDQSVAKQGAYRNYNLAELQAMLQDTVTTEEQKRKVMEEVNKRVQKDNVGLYDSMKLGWDDVVKNMRGKFQSNAQYVMDFGKTMANDLHTSISDTFFDAFTGKLSSIGDVWSKFTDSLKNTFFRMVSDIIAKKIIMSFTSMWDTSSGSVTGQGTIEKLLGIDVPFLTFAGGGSVPGPWNGRAGFSGDTVHAMLTPGEYVVRRDVANDPFFGPLLRAVNEGGGSRGTVAAGANIPAMMGAQGLAEGGTVAPWIPHYGWFGKLVSTLTMGISDILGITSDSYLPSLGNYIAGLEHGQKFDIFELLQRIQGPSGVVPGVIRGLGAVSGTSVADAMGYIGPVAGGIVGMIYGGPLGAAGGAYAGSNIASQWKLGEATGETNPKNTQAMQAAIQSGIAAVSAYVASSAGEYIQTGDGGVAKVPTGSLYTDASGQTYFAGPGAEGTFAVTKATPYQVAIASINASWEKAQAMGTNLVQWLSDVSDMSAGEMWDKATTAGENFLGASWDKLTNLPSYLFDQIMNFDPMTYVKSRGTDILRHFKLGLTGMSGGQLLDKSAMESALGMNQNGMIACETGTGLAGLPYTGPFIGHQGEIVKNKAESDRERGGQNGQSAQINIYFGNELIHSDMYKIADTVRVHAERRNMGTRRTV